MRIRPTIEAVNQLENIMAGNPLLLSCYLSEQPREDIAISIEEERVDRIEEFKKADDTIPDRVIDRVCRKYQKALAQIEAKGNPHYFGINHLEAAREAVRPLKFRYGLE